MMKYSNIAVMVHGFKIIFDKFIQHFVLGLKMWMQC